jgi:hypothetical protein
MNGLYFYQSPLGWYRNGANESGTTNTFGICQGAHAHWKKEKKKRMNVSVLKCSQNRSREDGETKAERRTFCICEGAHAHWKNEKDEEKKTKKNVTLVGYRPICSQQI